MKKKNLLKLKTLTATPAMKRLVKHDTGELERSIYPTRADYIVYERYRYIRAEVEEGILKIAIHRRIDIKQKKYEPYCTIFVNKEEEKWITYNHREKKWSNAMLYNLDIPKEQGEIYRSYYCDNEKERKLVSDYLKVVEGTIVKTVSKYQESIRNGIAEKRNKTELQSIDEFMETVPEKPKKLEQWILEKGYQRETYLIMKPGKLEKVYCTHCQKDVRVKEEKKPKHNEEGICPVCKSMATYKNFGRQNKLQDAKRICVIQKTSDRTQYVLRVYDTGVSLSKAQEYRKKEMYCYEVYRFRLDATMLAKECFEYTEYKRTGIVRWCHERPRGYYSYKYISAYGTLYTENIDKVLQDTIARYVPLKKLLERQQNPQMDCIDMLYESFHKRDEVEKLIKVGMYNMAKTLLGRECGRAKILYGCKKLEDILVLNKEYTRLAISMDATEEELGVIQSAYKLKKTITKEQVKQIARFYKYKLASDDILIFLNRTKLQKTLNYLDKVQKESGNAPSYVARDYEDYLDQLYRLGIKEDNSSRYPKDFYRLHEEYAERIRIKNGEIQKAEIEEQNKVLKEKVEELKNMYKANSEKFEIVWPEGKEDFEKEGQEQHNCVGRYFIKMVQGETVVFFLRKKENMEEPFCTVEFQKGECVQCRTKFNREAPEDAMKYMKKISEGFRKYIKENEDARSEHKETI